MRSTTFTRYSVLSIGLCFFLAGCFGSTHAPISHRNHVSELRPTNDTYHVVGGDSVHAIAQRFAMPPQQLIDINQLEPPYELYPGQRLYLSKVPKPMSVQPKTAEVNSLFDAAEQRSVSMNPLLRTDEEVEWEWPTSGRLVTLHQEQKDNYHKGIDFTGDFGDAVSAAADGRVVYRGNALRGYGNLLIIKHNQNFLSAYAHNEKILVKENDWVKRGDVIATKGLANDNEVRLHFEIRYQGKPVDPIPYLQGR